MPKMVAEDTSQTLTNKTVSGNDNTITDASPAVHTHVITDVTGLRSELDGLAGGGGGGGGLTYPPLFAHPALFSNATIFTVQKSTGFVSGADNTIYTVPTGRRALILRRNFRNATGGAITNYYYANILSSNVALTNSSATAANSSHTNAGGAGAYVMLEAGEIVKLNLSTAPSDDTVQAVIQVLEFDDTSPIKFWRSKGNTNDLVVPSGKRFYLIGVDYNMQTHLINNLWVANNLGFSASTYTVHVIRSGQTAGSLTTASSGSIGANGGTSVPAESNVLEAGETLRVALTNNSIVVNAVYVEETL